jgi:predicted nucleic acid-binding protein
MPERRFFDTSILIYAHDVRVPDKRKHSRKLLADHLKDHTAVVSTQVLEEYFNTATKLGVSAETARNHVVDYAQASVVQVTTELILSAIDLHRLSKISFWDALILRAAKSGGCAVVLSEDLNHGQMYDGVRIENPFAR